LPSLSIGPKKSRLPERDVTKPMTMGSSSDIFPGAKGHLAWQEKLEGPLFPVTIVHSKLIKPAELRAADTVFQLH
jgi:hypothetical protein